MKCFLLKEFLWSWCLFTALEQWLRQSGNELVGVKTLSDIKFTPVRNAGYSKLFILNKPNFQHTVFFQHLGHAKWEMRVSIINSTPINNKCQGRLFTRCQKEKSHTFRSVLIFLGHMQISIFRKIRKQHTLLFFMETGHRLSVSFEMGVSVWPKLDFGWPPVISTPHPPRTSMLHHTWLVTWLSFAGAGAHRAVGHRCYACAKR